MKKLPLFLLALIAFAGCKKKTDTSANLDITVSNVAGTYKMTGVSSSGVSVYSLVPTCKQDDLYVLTSTSAGTAGLYNYSIAEGTVSCASPSTLSSTYSVDNTAKTLTFNGMGSSPAVLSGVVVTSTSITGSSSNFPGFTGTTVTMTFTKQ